MRLYILGLLALLAFLNQQLWLDEDRGLRKVMALQDAIATETLTVANLSERNKSLEAEVKNLKEGVDAFEERARAELGMVRRGETFFHLLEDLPSGVKPEQTPAKSRSAASARAATAPTKSTANAARPATNAAKPATNAAKPATNAAKPATNPAKPATNAAKPATNPAKPATNAAKPATNAAKPATNPAKPATTSAKSAVPTKPAVAANRHD
jgi:cell division protein FtsB